MADRPPLAILAGVRVLSFTQFLLGPSGVQFLADLGADVVKIEPPGGTLWERNWSGCNLYLNGESAFFLLAHRNQRSLTLDLKKPGARAVARRLVERADVLVQNFRPGVMQRFGLDWEAAKSARLEKSPTPLASMFHPPPYGCYATKDGYLVLSMSPLATLAQALPLPELARYAAVTWNFDAREEIARLLEPVLLNRTTAEWLDRLVPAGVWAAPVQTHAETFADPAVRAADAVEDVAHPVAGRVRMLRFPVEFSSGRVTVRRPPPTVGEHTDDILREAGYGDAEIRGLRADGAV